MKKMVLEERCEEVRMGGLGKCTVRRAPLRLVIMILKDDLFKLAHVFLGATFCFMGAGMECQSWS